MASPWAFPLQKTCRILSPVECPSCGREMQRIEHVAIYCRTPTCDQRHVPFRIPQTELVAMDEKEQLVAFRMMMELGISDQR